MIRYFYALFFINVMNYKEFFNTAVILKQYRNGGLDYYE